MERENSATDECRHQVIGRKLPGMFQLLDELVNLASFGIGVPGRVIPVVLFKWGARKIFGKVDEVGFGGVLHIEERAEPFPA